MLQRYIRALADLFVNVKTYHHGISDSGEASSENDLGRFYFKIFARSERCTEACCLAAGTRGGGAWDPLAQLSGAEAGLQDEQARSAVA